MIGGKELMNWLHYGAVISLCHKDEEISHDPFVLEAEGFTNSVLRCRRTDGKQSLSSNSHLFKVMPPFSHDSLKNLAPSILYQVENLKQPIAPDEVEKINQFLKDFNEELIANLFEYESKKQSIVDYDTPIQLQHLQSHKFLSFRPEASSSYNDNLVITLDELPSEFSLFKMMSCYAFQETKNDHVKFGDHIYISTAIERLNKDAFLMVEPLSISNKTKKNKGRVTYNPNIQINDSEKDLIKSVGMIYLSLDTKARFELMVHSHCVKQEVASSQLFWGDTIFCKHVQTNSSIYVADPEENGKKHIATFRYLKSQFQRREANWRQGGFFQVVKGARLFQSSVKKLKSVARAKVKDLYVKRADRLYFTSGEKSVGLFANSLWRIENEDPNLGGPVLVGSVARLQNIKSRLFLTLKRQKAPNSPESHSQTRPDDYLLTLELNSTEDSLFEIVKISEENEVNMVSDTCFRFRHKLTGLYICQIYTDSKGREVNPDKINKHNSGKPLQIATKRSKRNTKESEEPNGVNHSGTKSGEESPAEAGLEKNETEEDLVFCSLSFSRTPRREDVYMANKVPDLEAWLTCILLNTIPVLEEATLLISLMHDNFKELNDFRLDPIKKGDLFLTISCIKKLIYLCYYEDHEMVIHSADFHRKTDSRTQLMLVYQGVPKILNNLIKAMYPDKTTLFKMMDLAEGKTHSLIMSSDFLGVGSGLGKINTTSRKHKDTNFIGEFKKMDTILENKERGSLSERIGLKFQVESPSQKPGGAKAVHEVVETAQMFRDITKLIFELLASMSKRNKLVQFECAKYLDTFMMFVGSGIGVIENLIMILKDNESLVNMLRTPGTIRKQQIEIFSAAEAKGPGMFMPMNKEVQNMDKSPSIIESVFNEIMSLDSASPESSQSKGTGRLALIQNAITGPNTALRKGNYSEVLQFMSNAAAIRDQGITANQLQIFEYLFNEKIKAKLLIPLEFKAGRATVFLPDTNKAHGETLPFALEDLFQSEAANKYADEVVHLVNQIQLLSSLCSSRNYMARDHIYKVIPFAMLHKYIWDASINMSFRSGLVSFLLCVYIDSKPRRIASIPDKSIPIDMEVLNNYQFSKEENGIEELIRQTTSVVQVDGFPAIEEEKDLGAKSQVPASFYSSLKKNLIKITSLNRQTKKPSSQNSSNKLKTAAFYSKTFLELMDNVGSEFFPKSNSFGDKSNNEFLFTENDIAQLKKSLISFLEKANSDRESMEYDLFLFKVVELARMMTLFGIFELNDVDIQVSEESDQPIGTQSQSGEILNLILGGRKVPRLITVIYPLLTWSRPKEPTDPDATIIGNDLTKNYGGKGKRAFNDSRSMVNESKNMTEEMLLSMRQNFIYKNERLVRMKFLRAIEQKNTSMSTNTSSGPNQMGNGLRRKSSIDQKPKAPIPSASFEVKVKKEILGILSRALEMRENSSLHAFILFLGKKGNELMALKKAEQSAVVQQFLENGLVFQPVMNNGLSSQEEEAAAHQKTEESITKTIKNLPSSIIKAIPFFRKKTGEEGPSKKETEEDASRVRVERQFIPDLIHLFMNTKNVSLEAKILELFFQTFSQRKRFIMNLMEHQPVLDSNEILLFKELQIKNIELEFLFDQTEIWLSASRDDKETKEIRQNVVKILNTFGLCLYSSTIFSVEKGEIVFGADITPSSQISYSRQRMLGNIGIADTVLRLLNEGSFIIEAAQREKEEGFRDEIYSVFRYAYSLLNLLCRNENNRCKNILQENLSLFFLSLQSENVGQVELLKEFFSNNSDFLYNISDKLLEDFFSLIFTFGRRVEYLQFINAILTDHEEPLTMNQKRVLSHLIDPQRRNYYLFMKNSRVPGQFKFDLSVKNRRKKDLPFFYHAELLRILSSICENDENKGLLSVILQKLIDFDYILDLLTKDDIFCFKNDLFKGSKSLLYSLIKGPLIRFLQVVWLKPMKRFERLYDNPKLEKFFRFESMKLSRLTWEDIEKMKEGINLHRFKEFMTNAEESSDEESGRGSMTSRSEEEEGNDPFIDASFEEISVPFANDPYYNRKYQFDYIDWLFNYVLPMVDDIKKALETTSETHYVNYKEKSVYKSLMNFSQTFKDCQSLFDNLLKKEKGYNRIFNKLINDFDLKGNLYDIEALQNSSAKSSKQLSLKSKFRMNLEDQERVKKQALQGVAMDLKGRRSSTMATSQSFLMGIKPKNSILNFVSSEKSQSTSLDRYSLMIREWGNDSNDPQNLSEFWNNATLTILMSEKTKDLIEEEQEALVNCILKVEQMKSTQNGSESSTITMESILKKMITFVQKSFQNNKNTEECIRVINLIRNILIYTTDDALKMDMQKLFDRLDVTSVVMNMICQNKSESPLLVSMIKLMNAMLEGGNRVVQQSVYNFLTTDLDAEQFFSLMNSILLGYIEQFAKKRRKFSEKNKRFQRCIENVIERQESSLKSIIEMLQLFCEGHNNDLQDLIREQPGHQKSYNLLLVLIDLLSVTLDRISENKYEITESVINTVIEMVQGPNVQNQKCMINSKFLENASRMLQKRHLQSKNILLTGGKHHAMDGEKKDIFLETIKFISPLFGKRVEDELKKDSPKLTENYILARLKHKLTDGILALAERETTQVRIKILVEIGFETLKQNLKIIIMKLSSLYKNEYKDEMFNHFAEDSSSPKFETPESKQYLEAIIESGFNIYFILKILFDIPASEVTNEELKNQLRVHTQEYYSLSTTSSSNKVVKLKNIFFNRNLFEKKMYFMRKEMEQRSTEMDLMSGPAFDFADEETKTLKQAYDFFNIHTGSVEICRENTFEKIFFPILPHCDYLPENIKKTFNKNVTRQSTRSKALGLVKKSDQIIEIMKWEEKLATFFKKNFAASIFFRQYKRWKNTAFILCCLQNFFILISAEVFDTDKQEMFSQIECFKSHLNSEKKNRLIFRLEGWPLFDSPVFTDCAFMVMGGIQSFSALLCLSFFIIKTAPLRWRKAWIRPKNKINQALRKRDKVRKTLKGIMNIVSDFYLLYYLGYSIA